MGIPVTRLAEAWYFAGENTAAAPIRRRIKKKKSRRLTWRSRLRCVRSTWESNTTPLYACRSSLWLPPPCPSFRLQSQFWRSTICFLIRARRLFVFMGFPSSPCKYSNYLGFGRFHRLFVSLSFPSVRCVRIVLCYVSSMTCSLYIRGYLQILTIYIGIHVDTVVCSCYTVVSVGALTYPK